MSAIPYKADGRDGARSRPLRRIWFSTPCVRSRAATAGVDIIAGAANHLFEFDTSVSDIPEALLRSFSRQRTISAERLAAYRRGTQRPVGIALEDCGDGVGSVSPSNAIFPVSISYSTQPNAQTSRAFVHRLSARLLGTHVAGRADHEPGSGAARSRRCARV